VRTGGGYGRTLRLSETAGVIEHVATFVARDGLVLRERSWLPNGEPRAVVGLLHGGAEHSGRYEHTAQRFTAAGAFDQRSHGASERVHGVPLQIERFDDLLDDTETWLASRRQVHGSRPFFVLAHSMGALISITLAARGRLDANGLITTGAALSVAGLRGVREGIRAGGERSGRHRVAHASGRVRRVDT
jgi:alpha-beta hydrolase superfamily lysophospholipase